MRRKSIGATSQAFHEPMNFRLRGLLARSPNPCGPAQRLKCRSKDGNPASHGTVKLRLRFPKAWVSAETAASDVGTWRETKPGYPPYPPPPPPTPPQHFGACKGERKRVFTLSAFGNHPTRPPRSADPRPSNPKPPKP